MFCMLNVDKKILIKNMKNQLYNSYSLTDSAFL